MVSDAGLLAAGQIISSGLSYLGTAIIARTLGPADWGGFTLILSLSTLASVAFDLQVGRRVLTDLFSSEVDESRTMGSLVTLRFAMGALSAGAVFAFAALGGYPADVVRGAAVASLILVIAPTASALSVFFQARIRLRPIAYSMVASRAMFAVLVIAFVSAGVRSIPVLLLCTVGLELTNLTVLWLISRRYLRIRLAIEPARWWTWGRESALIAAGGAIGTVAYRIDAVLLSQLDTLEAVGQYGVAYKFADLFEPISTAMVAPVLTLLVRAWPDDRRRFHAAFSGAFTLFAAVVVVPVSLMALFAREVTVLLYGDDFAPSANAGRLLVAAIGLAFFRRLAVSTLIAVERHRSYLYASLAGLVANVILNLVFIPEFSFEGAAATTVATELIQLSLLFVALRACEGSARPDWGGLRGVVVGVPVMLGVGALLGLVAAWPVAAGVAGLAYLAVLHLVGLGRPGGLRAVPTMLALREQGDDHAGTPRRR